MSKSLIVFIIWLIFFLCGNLYNSHRFKGKLSQARTSAPSFVDYMIDLAYIALGITSLTIGIWYMTIFGIILIVWGIASFRTHNKRNQIFGDNNKK